MKRILSLGISLALLAFIYRQVELAGLIAVLRESDRVWMAISLGMVVLTTTCTAWRLQQLVPVETKLRFWEANRLILAASVLNLILPSKMGDLAKAYFIRQRGHLPGSLAIALVVFEKACDLLALLFWCSFGLLFLAAGAEQSRLFGGLAIAALLGLGGGISLLISPQLAQIAFLASKRFAPTKMRSLLEALQGSWSQMQRYFWQDKRQFFKITLTSVGVWFLHLLQIWFFVLALNSFAPFLASLALAPLAIFAGLLPLTFAGVGTRDAALIWLYRPYFEPATAAALGLLCTSRYLLPAIAGLPFLQQYLTLARQKSNVNSSS